MNCTVGKWNYTFQICVVYMMERIGASCISVAVYETYKLFRFT